jgi:ABC-type phosphate/phosphonate transport system substrate-binding protein
MFEHQARVPGAVALLLGLILLLSAGVAAEERAQPADAVRIGLISTLFRDTPEPVVLAMMQPFGALMEAQTGVGGELVAGGDADVLGQSLAADKVRLGVFHGIEFAWARLKHPQLRPLVIAVNQQRQLYAHVIVRTDNPAAGLADLKDKSLAVPRQTKEHCRVFVYHRCRQRGQEPDAFFSAMPAPASVEDALDDVVDREVEAAVVDGVALECYQRRKPGRFAKLKTVHQSEAFPAAVVAYRPGAIEDATLERFRAGLLGAHQTSLGRQMLTLWKLTGFEAVPAGYEQNLASIAKAYPPTKVPK